MEFLNNSTLEFSDISSEAYREYNFGDGNVVRIEGPLKLHVSDNGHRVFDEAGISHYVPMGWIHLHWEPKSGQPNFVR